MSLSLNEYRCNVFFSHQIIKVYNLLLAISKIGLFVIFTFIGNQVLFKLFKEYNFIGDQVFFKLSKKLNFIRDQVFFKLFKEYNFIGNQVFTHSSLIQFLLSIWLYKLIELQK